VHALRELGVLTGSLANTTDEETIAILFDTGPYYQAKAMIESGTIITPPSSGKEIGIGYLNSDHDAALFVAVKNWQYFNDNYGIALKPVDRTTSKPEKAELIVNGQKIANVRLVPGDAGPQLMQLASTNAIQMAYVGNPPVIAAADKGTPIKIVLAINTEGSGVVVSKESPATDWKSFVDWAKARSAAGKPLVIAAPGKGSIQDVMIRYSLEESDLSIIEE
jgi:NitT/TauT family transport system substrate-binding protein